MFPPYDQEWGKKMFTLTTLTQHCTGGSSHAIRQEKKNEKAPTLEGKVKLCLFVVDVIVYTENPI